MSPVRAARPSEAPFVPPGYAGDKFALVVPTLGEAGNLDLLLRKISAVLRCTEIPYEILVVDDDSCDGTEEVVSAIAVHDPRVRLFIRKGERGLSGAILHGWQRTDAAILGVMDADLQHPPELLPRLLAEIRNGHDLAIGSRYAGGGRLGEWNPVRKLISTAAIWFTWPLQRPWLRAKDPMSGYFLMRRHCVQNVMFQPAGFKLLLEILVRGHIQSVQEVPFTFGRRSHGCSKAGFRVAWEYLLLLVSLYRLRWTGMRVSDSAAGD